MKKESSRADQINEGAGGGGVQVNKDKVHLESRCGTVQNEKREKIPFIKLCPSHGNSNIEITAPVSCFAMNSAVIMSVLQGWTYGKLLVLTILIRLTHF
jgi:hypothetical protein